MYECWCQKKIKNSSEKAHWPGWTTASNEKPVQDLESNPTSVVKNQHVMIRCGFLKKYNFNAIFCRFRADSVSMAPTCVQLPGWNAIFSLSCERFH